MLSMQMGRQATAEEAMGNAIFPRVRQETSTRDINSERCRNDDSGIGGEQCSSDDCDSRQRNSDGGAYRTRHCGL